MLSPKCEPWLVCLPHDNIAELFTATNGWESEWKGGTHCTEAEQAALCLLHGEHISCFLYQFAFSLSFLLDFVWKSKEEKTRAIEVAYVIIAFHLKMIMLCAWMWSNKYAQAERYDKFYCTVMQRNQGIFPCYFTILKGIIDISYICYPIILYGPKLGLHQW